MLLTCCRGHGFDSPFTVYLLCFSFEFCLFIFSYFVLSLLVSLLAQTLCFHPQPLTGSLRHLRSHDHQSHVLSLSHSLPSAQLPMPPLVPRYDYPFHAIHKEGAKTLGTPLQSLCIVHGIEDTWDSNLCRCPYSCPLIFADKSILFVKANAQECSVVIDIISQYDKGLGQ